MWMFMWIDFHGFESGVIVWLNLEYRKTRFWVKLICVNVNIQAQWLKYVWNNITTGVWIGSFLSVTDKSWWFSHISWLLWILINSFNEKRGKIYQRHVQPRKRHGKKWYSTKKQQYQKKQQYHIKTVSNNNVEP